MASTCKTAIHQSNSELSNSRIIRLQKTLLFSIADPSSLYPQATRVQTQCHPTSIPNLQIPHLKTTSGRILNQAPLPEFPSYPVASTLIHPSTPVTPNTEASSTHATARIDDAHDTVISILSALQTQNFYYRPRLPFVLQFYFWILAHMLRL
jgi:hypothetical protein